MEMDIQDFLGTNYCDLFDPPECIFDLRDSLNNDWLESIFSSSSPSSSASPPMTGTDDLLPGSNSPDSVQYEHSYSIGSCDSSSSGDSWTRSDDERGKLHENPFDFLRDIVAPGLDLNDCLLEDEERIEPGTVITSGDKDIDLDRWTEGSPSSLSSSIGLQEESVSSSPPVAKQVKKNIILVTDEDGQTMRFAPEEPLNNNDDELILVDWTYDEDDDKNPLDLSICKGKFDSSSDGVNPCKAIVCQTINPYLSMYSLPSQWQNDDKHATHSFTLTEALFSNPVPREGLLLLTDEEKNTLVAEGYPIPTKLPLGKAEEKYLKKIRRKIKNKISAQESRRKKKEYMDHLELKMHKYCQENAELLKKVEKLENNNRMLIVQLQNAHRVIKKSATSTGGTTLMVLVLFFAAFIGSRSPISWSIGYGRMPAVDDLTLPAVAAAAGGGGRSSLVPCGPPVGPDLQHPMIDVYSKLRGGSRLLMSTKDEEDALSNSSNQLVFGPSVPASYMSTLTYWFNSMTRLAPSAKRDERKPGATAHDETVGFSVTQMRPLTQSSLSAAARQTTTSNETLGGHWPSFFVQNIQTIAQIETRETTRT